MSSLFQNKDGAFHAWFIGGTSIKIATHCNKDIKVHKMTSFLMVCISKERSRTIDMFIVSMVLWDVKDIAFELSGAG